ncbi:MmcQ/YjbR family DNA-binding protein [Phenylobacterium sp.]|uniref:MmcQ/YjbR family DNA-binding protein n=1 Tax=Phenylobacterium sp. TaxID=1871053 RepID=UPI001214EFA9|nr:MmcQ/YjbR family DNA-binding protein [Phenylobacterium sp.]THD57595.1 MAG: MmcQ/YjbR family DNA-binding protein [Phenylobacterium sp.]
MVDDAAVRRLALALPEVEDRSEGDRVAFEVRGGKGIAWTYLVRAAPKKPRVPQPDVLAVRCALERKEMLVAAAPDRFFDDDHYRGFPAVLVRLPQVDEVELAALLRAAWRLSAPRALLGRLADD